MLRRALLFACSLGAVGLVSPVLRAQQVDATARAQALFDAGLESRDRGKMGEACALFEASIVAQPTPHGWLQVGSCRERTDAVSALESFEAALAAAGQVDDPARRKAYENAARERVEQLTRRVPTVVFRPSPTPVVSVDVMSAGREDRSTPVDRYDEPIRFNPGQYRVRAWAAGFYSHLFELELLQGERRVIAL